MDILKSIRDIYFYSSLHIALCAVMLFFYTDLIFIDRISYGLSNVFDPVYAVFLFSGTMVIYNVHRYIGFKVKGRDIQSARFDKYRSYGNVLLGLIIVFAIIGLGSFCMLDQPIWHWIVIGGLLSLAYIFPVFPDKKRLRDYDMIKIWIIAITWTILTIVLPLRARSETPFLFLYLERILFFVAITIPFDIRDLYIDKHQKVQTIPSKIGIKKSKFTALILLMINVLIVTLFFNPNSIYFKVQMITYVITSGLILGSNEKRRDLYYTGLLDGTIGLPLIIYYILQQLAI